MENQSEGSGSRGVGEGAGLPGQGKAGSGRGDTQLGAQPCPGPFPPHPQRCRSWQWRPRDIWPELSSLVTVPPPHTSATVWPPDTALSTADTGQEGLIMESHSRTALLRGNSAGFPQTLVSCENSQAHRKYPPWPSCGVGGSRGTAQPL